MTMRRVFRAVIDVAALWAVSAVVYAAHGLAWSIVAILLTMAYSVWVFIDGATS